MSKIKFIYFDIGGVLIDWKNAFKTVTKKFNIPFDTFIKEWDIYNDQITRGKISPQEFWNNVRDDLKIREGKNYNFLESWIGDYKAIRESFNFIVENEKNIKIGILSNIYKGMMPLLKSKNLIPNINYSLLVESCEIGMKKPEKEIYLFAQEKTGLKPNDILLVDDRSDFIEAANQVGWNTFLFNPDETEISISELSKILG